MLDKHAIEKRRRVLLKGLAGARGNQQMTTLYERSLDRFDQATATFLDLEASAAREMIARQRCIEVFGNQAQIRADRLLNDIEQLSRRMRTKLTAEEAEEAGAQAKELQRRMNAEGVRQETRQFEGIFQNRRTAALDELKASFQDDIVTGKTTELTRAGIRNVVMVFVGLASGLGTAVDAFLRLRAMDDFEEAQDRTTIKRVRALEQYCDTVGEWTLAAETLIARLDGDTELWEEC